MLTLLAQNNKGLVQFVDEGDLEEDITRFFLSVNNPVLINTSISFTPDIINGIYPSSYPNLYKGQQLILSGRYIEPQLINMHIEGQAFNVPVEYDFEFDLADSYDNTMSILPKVWAKQKIDDITLDFYLAGTKEEKDSIQSEIDSTSICYGVISSEFTSFDDNSGGGSTETIEYDFQDSDFIVDISPNPFKSHIDIDIITKKSVYKKIYIEILDVCGKSILKTNRILNGHTSKYKIDGLEALQTGMYICKINIGNEVFTIKIVKL